MSDIELGELYRNSYFIHTTLFAGFKCYWEWLQKSTQTLKSFVYNPQEIAVEQWNLCLEVRSLEEPIHFSKLHFLCLLNDVFRWIDFINLWKSW